MGLRSRAMPLPDPTRASEDDDVYRSAQALGHDRAHGPRRCDERGRVPGLCATGSHSNLGTRRYCGHGQPARTQGGRRAACDRKCGMPIALSPALQPGLQSHREGIRQTEGGVARQSRANRRGVMGHRRPDCHYVRAAGVRQLLQILRI